MSGTTPRGVEGEQEISAWVRDMFAAAAPRYDLLNHLLSFNVDRYWRTRTVRAVREWLIRPGARIVDLCCGTGDLMLALQQRSVNPVLGSDFCRPMLISAKEKAARRTLPPRLFEADALSLPMANASADLITVAFGFRNFVNYERGLVELKRVLRPGGAVAILEFSQPPNALFAKLYNFYSLHVLPKLGNAISGSKGAYNYLPESVKKFPGAEELAVQMCSAGYREVTFERMTFGIVALHIGRV